MPRYEKGTLGKFIGQDWNVISTYGNDLVLRAITRQQMAALITLCTYLEWRTRYINPPTQDEIDAFKSDTVYNLMTDIEICALVIGCITDDEDVRNALNQWFIDQINAGGDVYQSIQQVYQENVGGQPMPPGVVGAPLVDVPDCDLDLLFGAISYLIEQMDTNNTDGFEVAEEFSNPIERAKTLISAIPLLSELPVDELLDYAQGIWTDDLFEAYNANYTSGYYDELRCDLFCIAQNHECTLTVSLLFHYFMGRIGADPTSDVIQLVTYLTLGVWTGTQVCDIFFAFQCAMWDLGNQFFDVIGIKSIKTYMAIGLTMPDETWSLICDVCNVCTVPNFITVDPDGYPGGTVVQTDNMDGTFTLEITPEQGGPDNAYRVVCYDANQCCWQVVEVTYSLSPANLDSHYVCEDTAGSPNWYTGLHDVFAPATVGMCLKGIAGSDVSAFFTVTMKVQLC